MSLAGAWADLVPFQGRQGQGTCNIDLHNSSMNDAKRASQLEMHRMPVETLSGAVLAGFRYPSLAYGCDVCHATALLERRWI